MGICNKAITSLSLCSPQSVGEDKWLNRELTQHMDCSDSVRAGRWGGYQKGTPPRPGTQGDPWWRWYKREGVAFKTEWPHLKKPGIKRGWRLLGNWQWFSPFTQRMEWRKAGEELGSAVSSPNLPTAGLATGKFNLLCSAPQSHLPLSILSPPLPSSFRIYSPLLGQKIPTQLVPYSLALERIGKLGSR